MNKINWKQKLSSRKLWTAVVGIVVGLAAAFGLPENDYAQIAGIVASAMSVLAYIFGEAHIDSAKRNVNIHFGDNENTDNTNIKDK